MQKTPVVTFVDIDQVPPPRLESRGALAHLLEVLARERIILIFCSIRTRAQIESTRQIFGVFHPFIAENGAAAFVPERYFGSDVDNTRHIGGYHAIEFAPPYDTVVDTVRRVADRLGIGVLGFSDMSVEQVARECGLSLLEARLARLREYGEPFRLLCANPVAERRLFRALEAGGLTCRPGERFNLASAAKGPQAAIAALTTLYRAAFGSVVTAGVRDATGATEIVPHVDAALGSIVIEPDDADAGVRWLERIAGEAEAARAIRAPVRSMRVAR
jgi:mannosyl-3-phosphoglycerate phosphatase